MAEFATGIKEVVMIPMGISRDNVLAALARIDREGVPPARGNRSVELLHGNKAYPPKLVMSLASEVATGRKLPSSDFITQEAERYLLRLGFAVVRAGLPDAPTRRQHASSLPAPMLKAPLPHELEQSGEELLHLARLYRWSELWNDPSLPPRSPGIYGWFFRRIPPEVPTESCIVRDGATLLYVGISPANEKSKGTLRDRLSSHFEGIAEFSTLRTTLGCLLEGELGTILRRVGSGRTQTFLEKESALSKWIADNALVAWVEMQNPWVLEDYFLKTIGLPLNIEGNSAHPFCARLKEIRKDSGRRAMELDIDTRPKTLFLVSWVSEKHDRPMPARELYCSDWFQKARGFVEKSGADWFILSAKYGLVPPDQVIETVQ